MHAVAGDRPLDAAAVAQVNAEGGGRADAVPVQDKVVAEEGVHGGVGVEHGAEEAAVRAALFVGEFAQEVQAEDGAAGGGGGVAGGVEVVVPVEAAEGGVFLSGDRVEGVGEAKGEVGIGGGLAAAERGDGVGVGVLQPIQAFGPGGTQGFAGGAGVGRIRTQGEVDGVGIGGLVHAAGPRRSGGGGEGGGESGGEGGSQECGGVHGGASGSGVDERNVNRGSHRCPGLG